MRSFCRDYPLKYILILVSVHTFTYGQITFDSLLDKKTERFISWILMPGKITMNDHKLEYLAHKAFKEKRRLYLPWGKPESHFTFSDRDIQQYQRTLPKKADPKEMQNIIALLGLRTRKKE